MGRHMQVLLGPAGVGKSTYCSSLQKHFQTIKRSCTVINLDPAAEHFKYTPNIDIRELVALDDVARTLDFGPNGGLVYCLEHLINKIEWLKERMDEIAGSDDEYFIVDCPGQIELFTHNTVFRKLCRHFSSWNIKLCGVYLLDCMFMNEPSKYLSGAMMALSTMIQLEIGHVNVISKCDLRNKTKVLDLENETNEEERLFPSMYKMRELVETVHVSSSSNFKRLHHSFCDLLEDYPMVNFLPLDLSKIETLERLLIYIDNIVQYGEDVEPTNKDYDQTEATFDQTKE